MIVVFKNTLTCNNIQHLRSPEYSGVALRIGPIELFEHRKPGWRPGYEVAVSGDKTITAQGGLRSDCVLVAARHLVMMAREAREKLGHQRVMLSGWQA